MKTKYLIAILVLFSLLSQSVFTQQPQLEPLTNQDVVGMLKSKVPSDVIISKIKKSRCHFDTTPSVLSELKYRGVPDDVLMAMVNAPYGPAREEKVNDPNPDNTGQPAVSEVTVLDGTPLEIECTHTVTSADLAEGDAITFTVIRDVKVKGVTVVQRGSIVTGRVVKATKGKSWGRSGSLRWEMQDVTAIDDSQLPLRESPGKKQGESTGTTVATGAVVTGLIFLPSAALWGLKKGKAAVLPAGKRFTVFIHGSHTINLKK